MSGFHDDVEANWEQYAAGNMHESILLYSEKTAVPSVYLPAEPRYRIVDAVAVDISKRTLEAYLRQGWVSKGEVKAKIGGELISLVKLEFRPVSASVKKTLEENKAWLESRAGVESAHVHVVGGEAGIRVLGRVGDAVRESIRARFAGIPVSFEDSHKSAAPRIYTSKGVREW